VSTITNLAPSNVTEKKLQGKVFDLSDTKGLYIAISNIVTEMGGVALRASRHSKTDTMKKLRAEARKLVASYTPDCDFDDLVSKLAGVGYRMMDAAAGMV